MNGIQKTFFELIRVATGLQEGLSRLPSNNEWNALYDMAKKQSLVGVCFVALQRLGAVFYEGFDKIGISELLYLTWMGMAAKIQQRNEVVNRQCAELQTKLTADGYRICILKGQGVANIYSEHLRCLRQSGDIDVWIEGGFESTLRLAEKMGIKPDVAEHHINLPPLDGTTVEAHFIPSYLRCPWHNSRLQKWFEHQSPVQFGNRNNRNWCVPTTEFNLVFLMLHSFRHLTSEGVGLRQVMDYYFVLTSSTASQREAAYKTLCKLGLGRFCGAMMYVLNEALGMNKDTLLCEPNESEGEYLINDIMTGGNFGHHDNRVKVTANESKMSRYLRQTHRNMHQLTHYPAEAIFSPWWRAKVWIWRKWNGWI